MIRERIEENPTTSIRRLSLATGISSSSVYRATQQLNLSPYRPQHVIELSDDDFDRRLEFAQEMLVSFDENSTLLDKIIYSDESEFKLNGQVNRHNSCYWSSRNPHATAPVRHTSQGVMVWCGITSTRIFGPYFFDENVTGESYLNMLQDFLWPQIRQRGLHFQ